MITAPDRSIRCFTSGVARGPGCGSFVWNVLGRRRSTRENFENATSEIESTLRQGVSRNEIWRATLKMFAAHPIVGVGLGGYWIGITAYHDASGLMTPQEAHNDYLELLSSGGLIGFAIGCLVCRG